MVLRFETPEYWASLGVWVVRMAARKSLINEPFIFDSKEALLEKTKELVFRILKFKTDYILNQSILLKNLRQQKRLNDFF